MKRQILLMALISAIMYRAVAQGYATGFAISERYVITAYDVIGNDRSVQLKFGEGDWLTGEYVDGSEGEGWCLLHLTGKAPSFVRLEDSCEPCAGDEIYAFATDSSDGEDFTISFHNGDVISAGKTSQRNATIRHSITLGKSSLGAGLFSDDNDCAVGLVVGNGSSSNSASQYAASLVRIAKKIQPYIGPSEKTSRKTNRIATCVIRSNSFEGKTYSRRQHYNNTSNDTNTETYKRSKNSVAIIEGGEGRGTGFLCEMDGKKYFVTNRHVARQRGRMKAYFLDGTKLEFSPDSIIEVAENRDLVRFEINTNRQFLKASNATPDIGDKVEFYGNAGGEKVVTVTAGKILAVGQERIEIDAPIQGGNSGSPLVRVLDGCVIGVTTISTFNHISGDASKVGTRYDPNVKLTREFAVRFSGVTWKSLTYGAFLKRVNAYKDICQFYNQMKNIFLSANQYGLFEYALEDLKFENAPKLNEFMRRIAKSDEEQRKVYDRIVMMEEKNRACKGGIGSYGKMDFQNAYKKYTDKTWATYKTRKEVLEKILSFCKSTSSLSDEEREDVVKAYDWLYRTFCDKYRMELKGVFKNPTD